MAREGRVRGGFPNCKGVLVVVRDLSRNCNTAVVASTHSCQTHGVGVITNIVCI